MLLIIIVDQLLAIHSNFVAIIISIVIQNYHFPQ